VDRRDKLVAALAKPGKAPMQLHFFFVAAAIRGAAGRDAAFASMLPPLEGTW
jgi:hypothetical protein